jgi:hypothetical protein
MISFWWDALSDETGLADVFDGELADLAEETALEGRAGVPELVGLTGVSARVGFVGNFVSGVLVLDCPVGAMLLRLARVGVDDFPAGVLGRTGRVLVRLPEAAVADFPGAPPDLAGVVVGVLAVEGVLGLATPGMLVELGVGEMDGRDDWRLGALRRSARAACCCFRLSMSLLRGAYVPMV